MRIIAPIQITDAVLIASSLTENDTDDAPLYNAATAYTVGQRVRLASTHRVYEALQNSTGKQPDLYLTGTTPLWMEVRATNKYAAFDTVNATQAQGTTTGGGNAAVITYSLKLGAGEFADALAIFNLDAVQVQVQMLDSGNVERFNRTIDLRSSFSSGWKSYFFKKTVLRRDVAIFDMPLYASPTINITITKTNSTAKVGDICIGRATELGELQWAPEVRILDYSRKEVDVYGTVKFIKRRNAKLLSCALFVENEMFDEVRRIVAEYTSTALAWVGDKQYSSTIVFGFCRDFRGVLDSPAGSFVNLEIEGLV